MPKSKPLYPEAFKQQVVELAMAGHTPAELSRELWASAHKASERGSRVPRLTPASPCTARMF